MAPVAKVALAGASGQLGQHILRALREQSRHDIVVISRENSAASFPEDVTIKKVDYGNVDSLQHALQDVHAIVITLAHTSGEAVQAKLIEAAAKAQVPWILPNEWGGDGENEYFRAMSPIVEGKTKVRKQIEELGVSSWIGVATNPWFEPSMGLSLFGVDVKNKKATIYDDGNARFTVITLASAGLAVARLLALHEDELAAFKNKYVYISDMRVSQNSILDAAQKATASSSSDWDIAHASMQGWIDSGHELVEKGDWRGQQALLFGPTMQEGKGGDFETARQTANELLRLPRTDLCQATMNVVESM